MTETDSVAHARGAVEAWNARDVDRYVNLLAEDCVIETHGVGHAVRGRDAARKMMQKYFNAAPDLTFDVIDVVASGDRVFMRWIARRMPRSRLDSADAASACGGCTVATVQHGKIVHLWHYWDTDEIVRSVIRGSD